MGPAHEDPMSHPADPDAGPDSATNALKRKNDDTEGIDAAQLSKRKALVADLAVSRLPTSTPSPNHSPSLAHSSASLSPPPLTVPAPAALPGLPTPTSGLLPTPISGLLSLPNLLPAPASSPAHAEKDPSYVLFRMYCPIKEASIAVGKKGDTIKHLREKANVRIDVSENLKNTPERIVTVRGPAENVAKAFGLLVRIILDEPEDEPALELSKPFNLKILIPHPLIGFIIGKQGAKFREIEDKSAAKLKAAEVPLPYLTDRILSIVGVADAVHIAVFYVAQVVNEYKDCLKKFKAVYYNPKHYTALHMPAGTTLALPHHMQTMQLHLLLPQDLPVPYPQLRPLGFDYPALYPAPQAPAPYRHPAPPPVVAPPDHYTDEYGNQMVGNVVVGLPVSVPAPAHPDRVNQDVFVPRDAIGLVIGKRGNNIKHIREHSGCVYVKIEPDAGQSLTLGKGLGLTPVRKLTLTGSLGACQAATYLINQRIVADKERNDK